ncbi:putative Sugar transporter [Zostera marina]|uniref:Putative Sugar transporter n=1 Tax=Zostera marina TaxID=29655 RepID=A0A0K9P073_ZOSMR|nr:putative Sugar transporter [Zostera marina]
MGFLESKVKAIAASELNPMVVKNKYVRMDEGEVTTIQSDRGVNRDVDDELAWAEKISTMRRNTSRRYVFACAIFASLNSVLLGYDVGVMSGAILFIHEDLKITEVQQEILVGCLSVVSILGSLAAGRASDVIGRKWTMGLAAIIFQVGAIIMVFAPSFPVLMIGRLITGIGIGFAVVVAPVYIAEISPSVSRGSFTSFPEIFINLGILLGYVSNYAFSGLSAHINWRVMLGVGILPSVIIAIALFKIPESPRWLVMVHRTDEARIVLSNITESEVEIEQRMSEIEAAASIGEDEKDVWREIINPSPVLRRMLITGIGIQCFQQITGIDATVYYSPTIFKKAGITNYNYLLRATVAVGFTKTISILIPILTIDRMGRKVLLYVSTVGMTLCLLGLSIALTFLNFDIGSKDVGIGIVVLAVCGNVAFFSVGMGPIAWVISSEIFPLRVRAQACAISSIGNRLCSGLIAMSFLSVARVITIGGTFFLFTLISALSVVFMYVFVPETKGKSLEEIELMFHSGSDWQNGGSTQVQLKDVQRLVDKI